ncbi:hypothetical protein YOLOSWAG_315 [Erwinia phage vB_EamM_Yoloswag]|uniref:Uncharacterized protein n=1 Tax=Erwinia phage vB_EamM_Yoloswag TaxID=1958956 RepID=A0A1S6L3M0_9CAUD|nr:hypothetical protein HOR66_gp315 [Erwinia phage vB_EamM_Yoloswag]AQT28784.1 hypothetical protein YOLOSWAG_315 [Erwinia phage vB_EamM_Yoloswag]
MNEKTKFAKNVIAGAVAQTYSRLTLAASQGLFLYYQDLCPIMYGMHFDRLSEDQSEALWQLLAVTMELDAAAGRLPLAALFVSRRKGEHQPRAAFYEVYKKLYGETLDAEGWRKLVERIWQSYAMPPELLERL